MPNPFFMLIRPRLLQSLGQSKLCNRSGLSGFSARFASPQAQPSVTHLSLSSLGRPSGSLGQVKSSQPQPQSLTLVRRILLHSFQGPGFGCLISSSLVGSFGTFSAQENSAVVEPFASLWPSTPLSFVKHNLPRNLSKRSEPLVDYVKKNRPEKL